MGSPWADDVMEDLDAMLEDEQRGLGEGPGGEEKEEAAAGPGRPPPRPAPQEGRDLLRAGLLDGSLGAEELQELAAASQLERDAARLGGDPAPAQERPTPEAQVPGGASAGPEEELFPGRGHIKPTLRAWELAGDCVAVVDPETGTQAWCRLRGDAYGTAALRSRSQEEIARRAAAGPAPRRSGLLGEPIEELERKVYERRQLRAQQETLALHGAAAAAAPEARVGGAVHGNHRADLWVQKYAPRRFVDLLSSEEVNRGVMKWLKAWDHCVFDVPLKTRPKRAERATFPPAGTGPGGGRKREVRWNRADPGDLDPLDHRPVRKVILLCGPPGLGKTTLAHVAARACGYRVVEVNASDDRSAGTLRSRIMDAIQMQPVMGEKRPNCVVLDEIDGALGGSDGKGAIQALLQIVKGGVMPKGLQETPADGEKGRKGKRGPGKLQRPIICICNDPYVPALKPLREEALVYRFQQTDQKKLAARLRWICREEDVETEGHALGALCTQSECDIRSCLNTLQFVQKQGRKLTVEDVGCDGIGAKDLSQNIFKVMEQVFFEKTKSRPLAGRTALPLFSYLMDYGEHPLVACACHENLHRVPYRDIQFKRTAAVLEWLSFGDRLEAFVNRRVDNGMMAYQPLAAMATRALAAAPQRAKVQFPRQLAQLRRRLAQNGTVLTAFLDGGRAVVRLDRALAAGAVVPLLRHILNPEKIKPKDPRLMTKAEKHVLQAMVDAMVRHGLSFQVRAEGVAVKQIPGMVLEPPIDKLGEWNEGSERWQLVSRPLRQILAREIELRRLKRREVDPEQRAVARAERRDASSKYAKDVVTQAKRLREGTSVVETQTKKRAATWLDRAAVISRQKANELEGLDLPPGVQTRADLLPVLFKFNEGVTNAVKTELTVHELLS